MTWILILEQIMFVASQAGGLGEATMKRFKVKIISHVRATLFSFSKQSKRALISCYRPSLEAHRILRHRFGKSRFSRLKHVDASPTIRLVERASVVITGSVMSASMPGSGRCVR